MHKLKLVDPVTSDAHARSNPHTSAPATMAARRASLVAIEPADAPRIPIWEVMPRGAGATAPTTSELLHHPPPVVGLPADVEDAIVQTATRPLAAGENHQSGNANRERELRVLFAQLEPVQAYELGRRLDRSAPGDVLAAALGRLMPERRQRLRAFLADARRRQSRG